MTHSMKWSVRNKSETDFVPFAKGDVTFEIDSVTLGNHRLYFSQFKGAELISNSFFMIPNRVMHIATQDSLYTFGPVPKSLIEDIPFEFQKTHVRSFWRNEFMVGNSLLLIAIWLFNYFYL